MDQLMVMKPNLASGSCEGRLIFSFLSLKESDLGQFLRLVGLTSVVPGYAVGVGRVRVGQEGEEER